MKTKPPAIVYAVYPPPHPALPYLSVAIQEDGTVTARTFFTADEANAHHRKSAGSDTADNIRH